MKKVSVAGRTLMAVGLMCALCGLSAPQEAWAGTWTFYKDGSGTNAAGSTTQSWKIPDPPRPGGGYPAEAPWPPPGFQPILNTGTGGGNDASTSGTLTFKCTWTPSYVGEQIPKAVLIYTMARASVQWLTSASPTPSYSGSVNDGVNTVSTPVPFTPDSYGGPTYEGRLWQTGARILKVVSSGGVTADLSSKTWTVSVDLSAQFSGSGGGGGVAVSANQPVEDTRSVKITRGGAYEREELKNGEWHVYGDSIYSAKGVTALAEMRVPLSFGADYPGSWINKTAVWSPKGFAPAEGSVTYSEGEGGATGTTVFGTPKLEIQAFGPSVYKGEATGPHEHTTDLTVTDTDGASATAHYHLTLHDPVEVDGETLTQYSVNSPISDSNGPITHAYTPPPPPPAVPAPPGEVEVGSSTETGYSLAATIGISLEQELLGFKTGVEAEAKTSSTYTVSSTNKIPKPAVSVNQLYFLMASHHFERRHVKFYKFGVSGENRRYVNYDNVGNVFNPPLHTYHEAFKDSRLSLPSYYWSGPFDSTMHSVTDIPPTDPKPPYRYDYPSSNSS